MLNNILKLNKVTVLGKKAQRGINGGVGSCTIYCNSGVAIHNAPNSSPEVSAWACKNQDGPKGVAVCGGNDIPWDNPRQ